MFKAYLKEKADITMFETDKGFVGYTILPYTKTLEVADIYVKPEFRNGIGYVSLIKELERVAYKNNLERILCCVALSHNNPERSMYAILRLKFLYSHVHDDNIYFYKLVKDHENIGE